MEPVWDDFDREFIWLPEKLMPMWVLGVKAKHDLHGWKYLPGILWNEDTMAFIGSYESLRQMLGVVSQTWWWQRKKANEYRTYMVSTILSIESLGCDFAGWGTAFSEARPKANEILDTYFKTNRTRLLDVYMPHRHQMNQTELKRDLGPQMGDHSSSMVETCRKAAEEGSAEAQFNLGAHYYNGDDVPPDKAEAAKWWQKAAEQGLAQAQSHLGNAYHSGWGVPQDDVEAAKWISKAAEQGLADAQLKLALMYDSGWGVPRNPIQAHVWAKRAAEQHHAGAIEWLSVNPDPATNAG